MSCTLIAAVSSAETFSRGLVSASVGLGRLFAPEMGGGGPGLVLLWLILNEVGSVEIVLSSDPDHCEQCIASGVGKSRPHPAGR